MENPEFEKILAAVRTGDPQAVEELVRRYEPVLRHLIRIRLHKRHLQRLLDSADVCQSVLANFFRRAAEGQFKIHTPQDLNELLVTMALNKFRDWVRRQHRHGGGLPDGWDPPAADRDPGRMAADQELVQKIRDRLTAEELQLFHENQVLGYTWAEIAAQRGSEPDTLRMRLARALARVQREFQTSESSHVS